MLFVSNEIFFNNGWDCCKCGKMTEHLKEGRGKEAKLVCAICGSYNVIVETKSGFEDVTKGISKSRIG
jgi:hypothetical protein